jgi:hypothetical protein
MGAPSQQRLPELAFWLFRKLRVYIRFNYNEYNPPALGAEAS